MDDRIEDTGALVEATERWFVHQGLPHVIDGYSATEDVFTRAAPFLGAVFAIEVFASFDDRFSGWGQLAVFLAAVAILVAAVALVNRLRGRTPFQLPDDIGPLELAAFVLVPAVLPLLFSNDRGWRVFGLIFVNLVVLGLTYITTSYGLLPMIRFGAAQMVQRIGQIGQLMARSLPLLLLFTAFVFLNAEMWQVASDFPPAYYAIVVVVLVLSGVVFMALRAPREVAGLGAFDSWEQVCAVASCTDAPIAHFAPADPARRVEAPPMARSSRANVALLVVIAQLVQVVLVALVIGLFYVFFGLLAVRSSTIAQWTTSPHAPLSTFDLFGSQIVVTWEHFAVAGFIAAFSALQFTVSMLTDAVYREEFYDDVTREIREVLAVRVLYHDRLVG